jgi:polyisoprenyl-phosphate glycosyltransferase
MMDLISIVVPVFNEQNNLSLLYERICKSLNDFRIEIIFVNDGSSDNSKGIIIELLKLDDRIKLIDFSRNFGHEAATSAGVENCKGNCVIIVDADLQDPPEIIPEMIKLWKNGSDVVYGIRESRDGESIFKKISSFLFYRFLNKFSDIKIPLNVGDFRLMDKKVIDEFKKLNEKNRFFRGLVSWTGFKQTGLKFKREKRNSGKTKYNYWKLIRLAIDSITSFSVKPLAIITIMGFVVSLASFFLTVYYIIQRIFFKYPNDGWTSIIVLIIFFGSFQIFIIGIIGEYIARMFIEVKNRPLYIISEIIDKESISKK